MTVRRYDAGECSGARKLPNGWLRADATIARTGIQLYARGDGTVRREYRPPEEVFDEATLESFEMVPVTDDHPPGLLDASNATTYAKGHLGEEVEADEDLVKVVAPLLITDGELVAKVLEGKQELSCGYTCDLDDTPGEIDGEAYDCVQRNIRGNHVAVVDVGRAGPDVRIRLDTSDGVAIRGRRDGTFPEEHTVKLKIDAIDFDVAEPVAQAIEKERKARADEAARTDAALKDLATAEKAKADELAKEKARADMAESSAKRFDAWVPMCFGMRCQPGSVCCQACPVKVECASVYGGPVPGNPVGAVTMDAAKEAVKATAKADADAATAAARARVQLEAKVTEVLGAEAKLDGSDVDLKRAVVAKLNPDVKLDGQGDAYVAAAYDLALASVGKAGLAALRSATGAPRTDAAPPTEHRDAEQVRADRMKASEEAFRKPTIGTHRSA